MLVYLAGNVGPSCGYVGLCWPQVDSCWGKRSEKWEQQKKHCKTHDILMVGGLFWGYVGPSWGYVCLSWGLCWPILGLCWPILGLCWPILELCWPILGLCWPILGLCWPILRPMLAHLGAMFAHLEAYLGPCWPILIHKIRKRGKNAKSTKHRKTRDFLATRGGRRQGRRPLSPTERRELPYGKDTARGPLAGFKGWRPSSAPPDFSTLHFIAVWAWKLLDGDLLQKYSPYVFWEKFIE